MAPQIYQTALPPQRGLLVSFAKLKTLSAAHLLLKLYLLARCSSPSWRRYIQTGSRITGKGRSSWKCFS